MLFWSSNHLHSGLDSGHPPSNPKWPCRAARSVKPRDIHWGTWLNAHAVIIMLQWCQLLMPLQRIHICWKHVLLPWKMRGSSCQHHWQKEPLIKSAQRLLEWFSEAENKEAASILASNFIGSLNSFFLTYRAVFEGPPLHEFVFSQKTFVTCSCCFSVLFYRNGEKRHGR